MDIAMTAPSNAELSKKGSEEPKLALAGDNNIIPQADIREAIISSIMIFTNRKSRDDKFVLAFAEDLLTVFQAHQQELLREILSHKQHEYVEGVEEVIDFVPVSAIQRLQNKTNDGGRDGG